MEEYLREYRAQLVSGRQQVIDNFEKTLLTLTTGALALSITFAKDILGEAPTCGISWLFAAWGAWTSTVVLMLTSYYLSPIAHSKAISQVDDGSITKEKAGGGYTTAIRALNSLGDVTFLVGAIGSMGGCLAGCRLSYCQTVCE